jgi:hypothetical protein
MAPAPKSDDEPKSKKPAEPKAAKSKAKAKDTADAEA